MPKPILIIVHDMGQHTEDSFKQEFIDGCKWAFNLYNNYQGKSPGDYAEILPVAYSDIFDAYRENISERATPAALRLQSIPDFQGNELTQAINALTEFESEINADEFFKTHWLDVFLYRFTLLGERVRIRVAQKIADAVGTVYGGGQNVHVLGHSLGTAVVHDTLSMLYNADQLSSIPNNLSPVMHKLGSIHMIANTSRVLESFVKTRQSIVRPTASGCIYDYREYRHKFDPITWPKPFDPKNNGSWISREDWAFPTYRLIEPKSVTNEHGNTHNIRHYIAAPCVHQELFKLVFDIDFSEEEKAEGFDRYGSFTLSGVAEDLKNSLKELRLNELDSIRGLAQAALKLKDFIEQMGGEYNV